MSRLGDRLADALFHGERSMLAPAGPAAHRLAELGWPVLVFFTVASLAVALLIAWAALRRTGSIAEHAPPNEAGGVGWVLVGGLAIPALSFGTLFFFTLGTLSAFPMGHAEPADADVVVTGHQWWWEVEYRMGAPGQWVTAANELHIPVGRPIDVELRTTDVIHSLWVPRLHGKVDLVPGLVNRIRLQADGPGAYPGACAELCGVEHTKMRFVVVAEPENEFGRWLERQRRDAAAPRSAAAEHGRALFEQGPCAVCHRVRGTPALATAGPDLTHLAGRRTIGSFLPNDAATLHAWITDAPSLKPGVRMPAFQRFSGGELHDLVAYLQGLE